MGKEYLGALVFSDGLLLVHQGTLEPAGRDVIAGQDIQDSFVVNPQGFQAVALAGSMAQAPEGYEWVRVRQLMAEESPLAAAACRALGLLNWRGAHSYCGACGKLLKNSPGDIARLCEECGQVEYPAISPAVIVRVEKEGKILLARHVQRSQDFYTCLAGYIETGETAEQAVRREVREETGIEVTDVCYAGSQPWPYPNQLMLAFRAQWASGDLRLQATEIAEAHWFDPADLPAIPPPGSVAYRLIHGLM